MAKEETMTLVKEYLKDKGYEKRLEDLRKRSRTLGINLLLESEIIPNVTKKFDLEKSEARKILKEII